MSLAVPLPLLDRSHLAAQTLGDAAFARELLGLFDAQCRRLLPGILDAGRPAAERADLAHTLKGSGLGVGATRVAALSGQIEERFRTDGDASPAQLDALSEAVASTRAEIARPG